MPHKRVVYSLRFLLVLCTAVAVGIFAYERYTTYQLVIENETDRRVIVNLEQTAIPAIAVAEASVRRIKLRELPSGTIVCIEDASTGEFAEGFLAFDLTQQDAIPTLRIVEDQSGLIDFRWQQQDRE